jgi:hypothetical protein
MPDAFALIPSGDDPVASSSDQLDVAASGALEGVVAPGPEDAPIPFGRTWSFDFEAGRFNRVGGAPAELTGADSLKVWLEAATRTALGAHPIFTSFGMENPEDVIGTVDATEALSDLEERLRDAILVHDRVADMEDVIASVNPDQGVVSIDTLTVITDQEDNVALLDVNFTPGI